MVHVPERDMSYDMLELIEYQDLLVFHRQTLNLYCKLAAHGNQKVAHILCMHVDEDQLMYAVKNHCKLRRKILGCRGKFAFFHKNSKIGKLF